MSVSKKKKSADEETNKASSHSSHNFIRSGWLRYIILLGIGVFYVIYVTSVRASDSKAMISILTLLIAVMVFLHTESGFIKMVRRTRTTVGLTAGLVGFGVALFTLVFLATGGAYYLIVSAIFFVIFAPLFFYKLYVTLRSGYSPINTLTQIGLVIIMLSAAFFFLSPDAELSVIDIIVIVIGAMVYGRGTKREKREAELEEIVNPDEIPAVGESK